MRSSASLRTIPVLVALLGLVAAACGAGQPAGTAYVPGTYLSNAGDLAGKEAVDWDKAETVRIELGEFFFKPNDITFKAGQPYKVVLVNTGSVKHEFTAGDFFASVAWRKAESPESEVKVPYFTEIEVFAGKEVELFFVPVASGTFDLVCEIEGHLEAGMKGTVTVTGAAPTSPAPVWAKMSEGPWVQDGEAQVKAANWDAKEEIGIELGEFFFEPKEIHLRVGQPYKVVLKNTGDVKHEFTAEEFFQTIAFRKIEDASGEYKAPAPREIEVFAGKEGEIYLIPTRAGTYLLVCEIEGHREAGMEGAIIVE